MTEEIHIPDNLPADEPFYSYDLVFARAATMRRRAAAMVADFDLIAGTPLKPVTPATFSRLMAIDSPFTFSGEALPGDVRNYVWLHSCEFTTDPVLAAKRQRAVLKRFEAKLIPTWRRWRYSRSRWKAFVAASYAMAAAKIAELFAEAFADAPPPGGNSPSVGASLEAQFVELFSSRFAHWPFATSISDTPLRKLYQLLRSINGVDYDKTESDIIAAELKAANEAAVAKNGGG